MILIRSIYITAIGWCLFLFLACLSHKYPDFILYVKSDLTEKELATLNVMILIACFGIAYRFIRQEQK